MTKQLLFSLFTCVASAALTLAQTNTPANKQIRDAEIARIKAYCQELDDYAKRNPEIGRIFADVSSGSVERKSRWREFKSEEEREEIDFFIDEHFPVYRTVKALPFYTLMSKPAAKTK